MDEYDAVYVEPPPSRPTSIAPRRRLTISEHGWHTIVDVSTSGDSRSVLHAQIAVNALVVDVLLVEVRSAQPAASPCAESDRAQTVRISGRWYYPSARVAGALRQREER